ncbi:hypothetical protein PMG11_07316 [Penicillium brasilianum]|uniref:Glycine-rich cell wall structural protein 1 n=1 Tax=Penicillium brasilianum TaxID=104259 RepID=A0A0F7TS88_PENBI|nr:hypothetical protein PMG11_07316 [Penicillium brasilianum]
MEAVSKVVNAATTALWGDGSTVQQQHGEEPIAGVQGKGNFNDPFDAGNREEQPDAPSSEGNTAPQEPRLDGAKTDPTRKDLVTDTKTDDVDLETTSPSAPSAPILVLPTLTSSALSPVPVAGGPTSSTPAEAAAPSSSTPAEVAAPSSSTTAKADAPLSLTPVEAGGSSAVTSEPKTEQRSTETSEGQSSQTSNAADREVSEEALKGPQGPVPAHAEDFEKEAKGIKPAKKEGGSGENDSSKSTDKSSQGSEKGNGNGKQSPLHKMKEKLSKVAHPRHGSNKA